MKYSHTKASYILAGMLAFSIAAPAFAITDDIKPRDRDLGLNVRTEVKAEGKSNFSGTDTEIQTKAGLAISNRIQDLQTLQSRINAMTRLSSTTKATLTTNITSEISRLTALRTKISSETGEALKADVKTITGSYRIYMMVIPQIRILAAADRAQTVAASMAELSVKLEARIVAAEAAGTVMTNERAALADMKLKIADAKVQATAATNLVVGLVPDEKDKAKMAANEQAIVAARAKLKIAHDDLKDAHKDAKIIVGEVKKYDRDEKNDDKRQDTNSNRGRN
jgi:hypothetical protein